MSSNFEQSGYLEKGLNSMKNEIGKMKEKLKRKRNCCEFYASVLGTASSGGRT